MKITPTEALELILLPFSTSGLAYCLFDQTNCIRIQVSEWMEGCWIWLHKTWRLLELSFHREAE